MLNLPCGTPSFQINHDHVVLSPLVRKMNIRGIFFNAEISNHLLCLLLSTSSTNSSGGLSNIDYTFGGKYSGSGSRSSVSSYSNSPLNGNISYEPRRVSAKMYNHVASRGTCTQALRPQPTPNPTRAPTPPPVRAPTSCSGSEVPLTVDLTTDDYAAETSYTLTNECTNAVVASAGRGSLSGSTAYSNT